MSEQTNITDDQDKAAAEKQDAEARRLVRIQLDEAEKREREAADKRVASMSDSEFKKYTQRRWGF